MNVAQAVDNVRTGIVQIAFLATDLTEDLRRQVGRPFVRGTLGTGFLVNLNGYVITARHVIEDGRQWTERTQAGQKQLHVGLAQPNTENMRGNFVDVDFDVVDEDARHDLALLKLRRNPFDGEVRPLIGNIPLLFSAVTLHPNRPRDGAAVGISGYPLGEPVLVTNAGWMATSWAFESAEVSMPGAPGWFRKPDIADTYLADVQVNPGNSGGPVYLIENGSVIGVCVASKLAPVWYKQGNDETVGERKLFYNSGLAVVVPARYVTELLRKHNLNWSELEN